MNPLSLVRANLRRNLGSNLLFALLIAFATALAVGISAQERALKQGSAHAADKFDLVVGAAGSRVDLLLAVVFARPAEAELIDGAILVELQEDPRVDLAAPIAFGDSVDDALVIGTTARFAAHLAGGAVTGRMFETRGEAVVGSATGYAVGDVLRPAHGVGFAADPDAHGELSYRVVGMMPPTGTPWDGVVVTSVETTWATHSLAIGHDPAGPRGDALGPPFDPGFTPGVPAIVVKPKSVASAYALRQAYRTGETTAFFPAESLVELYSYLGDAAAVMNVMAMGTQALVVLAILAGVSALMRLQRKQTGVLRALGAPRLYVGISTWIYLFALIAAGTVAGLLLGWAIAQVVSEAFGARTGMSMRATLSRSEVVFALGALGIGAVLALVPAIATYRTRIVDALSSD